jgi:hypothetical protein
MSSFTPETTDELLERITHTLRSAPTVEAQTRLLPHMRWSLWHIMHNVDPQELTPAETLVMMSVLTTAHSRWLLSLPSPDGTTGARLQLVRESPLQPER